MKENSQQSISERIQTEVTESLHRLPLYLNLKDKKVVIFGGGAAAAEKLNGLKNTQCDLYLISPKLSLQCIELLGKFKSKTLIEENYDKKYLADAWLVYAATNNLAINQEIVEHCELLKIWSNCVDNPNLAKFYSCSQFNKGPWSFAISTQGKYAGMSRILRESLEEIIPQSDSDLLDDIAEIRSIIKSKIADPKERRQRLQQLVKTLKDEYFINT